jgi:cellulose synthase/poly-beta-1,6-N-acetylglucosamine synthase-like glycosyltransferase
MYMTSILKVGCWASAIIMCYTYVGYPLVIMTAARVMRRGVRRARYCSSVSIVVCAYNEEQEIVARRDELTSLLRGVELRGEIVIVSDGSTDRTAAMARQGSAGCVRVLELPQNVGKAQALTQACEVATGDVIIFADTRQHWASDAIKLLLENFADPEVGGVSGDLCLEPAAGANTGVGFYWQHEKTLRKWESQVHSTVGVTGAICAVRRRLFRAIPPRTILDDLFWPMKVTMEGFRVVHDDRARAFDRLPHSASGEFRRKIRTLSGNFQLVALLPSVLAPWRNPIWFQFFSHKILRLVAPWLLLLFLTTSGLMHGYLYRAIFTVQIICYALAVFGMQAKVAARSRPAAVAASFLLLNAGAWVAFWIWIFGRAGTSWRKVGYLRVTAQSLAVLGVTGAQPNK